LREEYTSARKFRLNQRLRERTAGAAFYLWLGKFWIARIAVFGAASGFRERNCKPGVLRPCYFGCNCAANYLRSPYC
jgi:hypothetical protein